MSKPEILELEEKHDYSKEETVVGKWIDGRDVYKKTIEFTFSSTTLNWNKITTGLNIDFLIDTPSGAFMSTNKLQCYPLPYSRVSGGQLETISFWVYEGDLHENHSTEYPNGFLGYVTIKYVKKEE